VAVGEEVVGYASGGVDAETARPGAPYVLPERWREGIGGDLLDRFEAARRERGACPPFQVLAANARGRSFYRSREYEPVAGERVALFGEFVRELTFRRPLEAAPATRSGRRPEDGGPDP
jgi:GNAT superfamily N-acetyltransferase